MPPSDPTDELLSPPPTLKAEPDLTPAPDPAPTTAITAADTADWSYTSDPHSIAHSIEVARNCTSDWNSMSGSDCLRQCSRCRLWVIKADDVSESSLLNLLQDNQHLGNGAFEAALAAAGKRQLFRRSDGTLTIGDCYARRSPPAPAVLWNATLPFMLLTLIYAVAPGYIIPFLHHPYGGAAFVALVAWHFYGCWRLSKAEFFYARAFFVLMFTGPLYLSILLGPAVVTVLQAFESVHP